MAARYCFLGNLENPLFKLLALIPLSILHISVAASPNVTGIVAPVTPGRRCANQR
jgi:hypothetical protein